MKDISLFVFYSWIGFQFLTFCFPGYWWVESTPSCQKIILLNIFYILLFLVFFGLLSLEKVIRKISPNFENGIVGGLETAIRGIFIFSIFCGTTYLYWMGTRKLQPALYGVTPLFATLLIWIDFVHTDWKRKTEFRLIPKGEYTYESIIEFLRNLHRGYFWKMQFSAYAFLAVPVAFCWGATKFATEHWKILKWTFMFSAYGSIGLLLGAIQFLKSILNMIDQKVLTLKRQDDKLIRID